MRPRESLNGESRLTDVTNNARQLDVDNQISRIEKFSRLILREAVHTGHLNIDILISDSQRLPDLGSRKPVEEVKNPPSPPSTFALDWTQSGMSRCTPMHSKTHCDSHGDAAVDVRSSNATQYVRRPSLHWLSVLVFVEQ